MNSNLLLDLHTHSITSDGQYTPSELVRMAKLKDLQIISLTDHDSVAGMEEAFNKAEEIKLRFIPGIEISCQDIEEIHILGYGIDYKNHNLVEKCNEFEKSRLKRGARICDFLKYKGIDVDYGEVKSFAAGSIVARPHFARYLIKKGIVSNRKEAFDLYLDTEEFKVATNRYKPSCFDAINLIHAAGGKAVIAHPGLYKMSFVKKEDLIKKLSASGLDGIECIYSRHSKNETMQYIELSRKYNLKISAGSDFHGPNVKPDIEMGINVEKSFLKHFIIGGI